jgi:short-subunit dehydrogenase
MTFRGKVVLITGASSGIGWALAREFAARGAHLVLAARRLDRLQSLASELQLQGSRALTVTCDVTREEDLQEAVAQAVREFGQLDIVVANAGFGVTGTFEELTHQDYQRQFDTNVFGLMHTVRACLPEIKKQRGQVVLVGSILSHWSTPTATPYCMSKFAVRALAEGLSVELQAHGVGVTLISPGLIQTEISQVDRFGNHQADRPAKRSWLSMRADKAAGQMVDAIAARRSEVVITWHGKAVVWLSRYFPSLLQLVRRLRQKK